MAQSLVLSIDVCPGLGISPLQTNIWLSFSQADLGPRSPQGLFFSGFLKSSKRFFRRFVLIASGTEIFWRVPGIFEILTFYGNIALPLSWGKFSFDLHLQSRLKDERSRSRSCDSFRFSWLATSVLCHRSPQHTKHTIPTSSPNAACVVVRGVGTTSTRYTVALQLHNCKHRYVPDVGINSSFWYSTPHVVFIVAART